MRNWPSHVRRALVDRRGRSPQFLRRRNRRDLRPRARGLHAARAGRCGTSRPNDSIGEVAGIPSSVYNAASRRRDDARSVSCRTTTSAFERSSKRRKGFPSEQRVKRGDRTVHGTKDLIREAGPQRPVSVRLREVVSRIAACEAASSMDRTAITTLDRRGAPRAPRFDAAA